MSVKLEEKKGEERRKIQGILSTKHHSKKCIFIVFTFTKILQVNPQFNMLRKLGNQPSACKFQPWDLNLDCCCSCLDAKLCLILCISMDYSPPDSSVHGISQARILEWVDISFFRGIFTTCGLNLNLLHWHADSLLLNHQGNPSLDLHDSKTKN